MNKGTRILVSFLIILLFVGGSFALYRYLRLTKAPSVQPTPGRQVASPTLTQAGQEKEEKIKKSVIGTREVSRGTFQKVEGGIIFYTSNGTTSQLPLTADEVVLACTKQDLATATELIYSEITRVNILTPAQLGPKIPASETIVVFAQDVEGVFRAHTVAMAAESCGK